MVGSSWPALKEADWGLAGKGKGHGEGSKVIGWLGWDGQGEGLREWGWW